MDLYLQRQPLQVSLSMAHKQKKRELEREVAHLEERRAQQINDIVIE